MDTKALWKQVYDIADPIAQALQLELLEVFCYGKGPGAVIQVILDKEGGIGIKDCERFHRSLSHALDVADIVTYSYRLEASSPGLDRPLKQRKDYQRAVGKILRVKTLEKSDNEVRQIFVGRLTRVNQNGLVLNVRTSKQKAKKQDVELQWETIVEARREVEL